MQTRLLAPVAALVGASFTLCSAGCAVPLAPGYRILAESREVRFVPGPPAELQVRADFTLENSGNGELEFIEAVFPDEKGFGRKHLRVEVNGRDAAPVAPPEQLQHSAPRTLRIPLEPAWTQKQKRHLGIEYSLSAPEDSGARITIGENDFHLGSRGWFPVLQPPRHAMALFPKRPDRVPVSVHVPSNFLGLSRGTPAGRKQNGSETEYRFLLRKDDLAPFIVAGRYVESSAARKPDAALFWTLEPLKEDSASAQEQIAAAWAVLQANFGPLDKNIRALHIVESTGLRGHLAGEESAAAESFPGGALVNPAAMSLGPGSEAFLEKVTHALAHDWFGGRIYPADDARIGLTEGLAEYAEIVVDEARGGDPARRSRVRHLLREYDEAAKSGVEKPLGVTLLSDAPEQRRSALAKAPLLFIALEDACGEAPVRSGLSRLVTLLRGQEVGYDDLRAALEESSGKNVAEPFRVWLYSKGIPKDFRVKYEPANETQPQ